MGYVNFRKSIHSKEQLALRKILKEKRLSLGLSQRELAKKIGVVYSLISKIETGDRRLDFLEMIDYCRKLDIDPHDVINHIENL